MNSTRTISGEIYSWSGELAQSAIDGVYGTHKALTERNFRDNLKWLTGDNGEGRQAHHVLPQEHRGKFFAAGFNINNPTFGSWVDTSTHLGFSYEYNQDWAFFFGSFGDYIPTKMQILSFATELAGKYGFDIYFELRERDKMRVFRNMRLELTKEGFVEFFENGSIEKVVCNSYYRPDTDSNEGICTVHFYGKPPKELNIGCDSYNSQYGIPVSEDGTKLFIGSWYKGLGGYEKGLLAYDIDSGSVLWRFKEGKIGAIFVYGKYLIVEKAYTAVYKLDIDNGGILAKISSTTLQQLFHLEYPYVFGDTISGKRSVINVESMEVVKKYNTKVVNPFDCLGLVIQDVSINRNTLVISGFEECPNRNYSIKGTKDFVRVIDNDFGNW